ncbi:aldehyde dehydrogenase family protein [Psychromonas arctica]|uniref:Aldehyde dehydrogenase family protein n=1 Tax=Psychromonas arctica TaxID=168275 RepID=A0ABU9H7G0_9GAMM
MCCYQPCFCVHSNIANEFTEKVIKATQLIKAGNGLDSKTNIGPLITQQAVDKVSLLVSSAVEQGAKIAYQSELTLSNKDEAHDSLKADGFYPATVLTNVNNEMDIAQTEIFGPVISIMTFEDETEVIEQANATDAGLASYFYSQNMNQVWRVSDALQYGMVGINETALSNAAAPFGGIKESGSGREGSKYGLDDYLEIKYLCLGGIEQKS